MKKTTSKKTTKKSNWPIFAAIAGVLVIAIAICVLAGGKKKPAASGDTYTAKIEIENYGTITVALEGEVAPETVENFVHVSKTKLLHSGLSQQAVIYSVAGKKKKKKSKWGRLVVRWP